MGLRDFFRKAPKPTVSCEDPFWAAVHDLCRQHIDRMVALFRSRGWPRMDWAEPRFRALAGPDALEEVTTQARQALRDFRSAGGITVRSAGVVDSWLVMVSSFPSASDSEFLKACPKSSYQDFAHAVRGVFRNDTEGWERLDFAHWILLVDERAGDLAIHLHTIWSYCQQLAWIQPASGSHPATFTPAPVILPEELIPDPERIEALLGLLLREDALVHRQQSKS